VEKKIIEDARNYALQEMEKFGSPALEHFELTCVKGQEIAAKLNVDKDIVLLGTILMDLKLGECLKNGKLPEHVAESSKAAKVFLEKYSLNDDDKLKILNCVEAHHKTVPFSCTESEICANADCYRFLHPRGFIAYAKLLAASDRGDLDYIINQLEYKIDEKYSILSLDLCKTELNDFYPLFKKILAEAKKL